LADRLAEATATLLHKLVRTEKELWGYSQNEILTIEELLAEKNQGIRPAIGYPSLPDQSIIFTIDKLLHLSEAGITLTPNGAMTPHASVCGLIIAHPSAQYFAVGKIDKEQLKDYAKRRNMSIENVSRFLVKNI
jgi:cobalamin-dependent methionine synthase I